MQLAGPEGERDQGRLRTPRLAEMVADQIRQRILDGELEEGSLLPKESELRKEYPVNVQSLREALRILEAEGLITVRRGNRGGAVVHPPTARNVAYTMSTVLSMEGGDFNDVGRALLEVEPLCAAMCASLPDRHTTVVPRLREIHEESLARVDDLVGATNLARDFHEAVVHGCGNTSLIVLVGALEALWSTHVNNWVERRASPRDVPLPERIEALGMHGHILRCIEDGDATSARALTASHLRDVQGYPSNPHDPDDPHAPFDPALIRDRLFYS